MTWRQGVKVILRLALISSRENSLARDGSKHHMSMSDFSRFPSVPEPENAKVRDDRDKTIDA